MAIIFHAPRFVFVLLLLLSNAAKAWIEHPDHTSYGIGAMYGELDGDPGQNASGADHNTAIGVDAMRSGLTNSADNNSAVGSYALYSNSSGAENVAVGFQTLYSNTEGNYNTATGNSALFKNTEGSYNVGLGHQSGYSNQTGSKNIFSPFSHCLYLVCVLV